MAGIAAEVRLQILSDLHLETPAARPTYGEFKVDRRSPHLALLGDIGNVVHSEFFEFLERQLEIFDTVFFVLGNHEPYGTTYEEAKRLLRGFEAVGRERRAVQPKYGCFVLLDNSRFDLSANVTVIGCTLFSYIPPDRESTVSMFVSDFHNVHDWTVQEHNQAHALCLSWLNEQVLLITEKEPHRRILILTHYSPTISEEANDPRHLKDAQGVLSAFCSDLSGEVCWKNSQVVLWAFGHTHFNCDFVDASSLAEKRVVTNQKGYRRNENLDFDPERVFSIPDIPFSVGGGNEMLTQRRKKISSLQCNII